MTRLPTTSSRRALTGAGVAVAGLLAPALAAAPAMAASHHQSAPAHVTIVHGLHGVTGDIYVDGKKVLSDVAPEHSAGPLSLTPGHHLIQVRNHATGATVAEHHVTLTSGEHATAALGLQHGSPALFVYDDALRQASSHAASIVVRDLADTSGVSTVIDGHKVGGMSDGGQHFVPASAGHAKVAVVSDSSSSTVMKTQEVPITSGAVTTLYLTGSQGSSSLSWVATTAAPAGVTPKGVDTGNSGLASPQQSTPWLPIAAIALGTGGIATVLWRRRRLAAVSVRTESEQH